MRPSSGVTVAFIVRKKSGELLVQAAIATAAQMLHNVEAAGKKVPAGNIAYFALLHMKSGRRSVCRSRAGHLLITHRQSFLQVFTASTGIAQN
jgi:hypothetical protein